MTERKNLPYAQGHDNIQNIIGRTYKVMKAERLNTIAEAREKIVAFRGIGHPVTVPMYLSKLHALSQENLGYTSKKDQIKCDCSGYTFLARSKQGYHGATTNFCLHCQFFGSIADLGKDNLIPGMEVYQGCRKAIGSSYYYASHTGVYAGKHDFGDGKGLQHAVYQSSSSYSVLAREPAAKASGPALTVMNDHWTYWVWSKYVIE